MEDDQNLPELFNFAFILQGEAKHLEKIKEHLQEYVDKGVISLGNSAYDRKEIYILESDQWKEYQRLKNKDDRLIGYRLK